jgi:two-component system OmpR family response regulator
MIPVLNHILCVDDEADILQVAKLALEVVGGFRVSLCRGSEDAVEQARLLKPDLILLDVMMPVMDGPTTLKKLREPDACPDTPVIFMTAKARPEELRGFLDLGAIGVVSKPFDPMALSEQIRSLWKTQHESDT